MRALAKVKSGYDNMELIEMEELKVYGDRVKIKVAYSGICGSDLHTFKGEYSKKIPVVLGHEFSGVVVEVGQDVRKIKAGDRVTSETTFETCGACIYCQTKDYNLCSSREGIGTQIDGSFSEFILSREESVHILPDNVSLLSASLTEPLACCVHSALEKTTIFKNDIVLIFGPGPIGILLAQVIKSQGAYVVLAGIGMSIAANKVRGIRAAVTGDCFSARATREHNNSNILCLGERVLGESLALKILDEWLNAEFQGERHAERLRQLEEIERKNSLNL